MLKDARLAVAEEIPKNRNLDYAQFKLLTGGDRFSARFLNQNPIEITPTHKFIFSGNHLPKPDPNDVGLLRRWLQIPFEQDFTANPDEKLFDKLTTPAALSALLAILLQHAVLFYEKGSLYIPPSVNAERDNYFASENVVAEFISEFCEVGAEKKENPNTLIARLKKVYPATEKEKRKDLIAMIVKAGAGITYEFDSHKNQFMFKGVEIRKPSGNMFEGTDCDESDYIPFN